MPEKVVCFLCGYEGDLDASSQVEREDGEMAVVCPTCYADGRANDCIGMVVHRFVRADLECFTTIVEKAKARRKGLRLKTPTNIAKYERWCGLRK